MLKVVCAHHKIARFARNYKRDIQTNIPRCGAQARFALPTKIGNKDSSNLATRLIRIGVGRGAAGAAMAAPLFHQKNSMTQ